MRSTKDQRKFKLACYDEHKRPSPSGHGWVLDCASCCRIVGHGHALWEADHIVPHAISEDNSPSNSQVLCVPCHKRKYVSDRWMTDKAARIAKKQSGTKAKSRPMPGTRASGWRKRMDGSVERR